MANKPLQSIKFPGLSDTYVVPQIDDTLTKSGQAADAKAVGDKVTAIKSSILEIGLKTTGLKTENLFTNSIEVASSKYWDASGELQSSNSFAALGPIDISDYNFLYYKNTGAIPANSAACWVWLNNNGDVIKAGHVANSLDGDEKTINIPDGAISVKISIYKSFLSIFGVCGHITGELDNAKEDIENLINRVSYEKIPFTGDGYIKYESGQMTPEIPITSTAGWKYAVVECSGGDGFTIYGTGGTNARLWCFLDETNKSILTSPSGATAPEGIEVYAPENAVKLVINTNDGVQSIYKVNVYNYIDKIIEKISKPYYIADTSKNGLTWDWWFSEHVIDDYGNTYIGYIDKDGYIGVMMICTDGTTKYRRLAKQRYSDDHNSCGVNILAEGQIIVMSTKGHTAKDTIRVFIANEAYTVDCDFTDKSFDIPHPEEEGRYYGLTYSQIFIYNDVIYDFFRCVEVNGTGAPICYVKSSDLFDTFEFGIVVRSTDNYCKFRETNTDGLLRMAITKNPVQGDNSILHGFLNLATENLESDSGDTVGTLIPIASSEWVSDKIAMSVNAQSYFTPIVRGGTSFKLRLLDVAKTDRQNVCVLYGKSTTYASAINDFVYTMYNNGNNLELVHSGMPFYKVSYYLPGCIFGWDENTVFACVNQSVETQDKNHELKRITISNGEVVDETILRSAKAIIRPVYSEAGLIIASSGVYNDISGTDKARGNNVFYQWLLSPIYKRV